MPQGEEMSRSKFIADQAMSLGEIIQEKAEGMTVQEQALFSIEINKVSLENLDSPQPEEVFRTLQALDMMTESIGKVVDIPAGQEDLL